MKYRDIEDRRARLLGSKLDYRYVYYLEYDYSILSNILCRKKNGSRSRLTYSEAYIMLDTESSKDHPIEYDKEGKAIPQMNHIVAFTCSIRAFHKNLCTLRGSRPSELVHMLKLIRANIKADVIYIFVHNLPWDWQFIRRFMFQEFNYPKSQLNVKNHYPITIQFENGLILRDSLILAGVSLERWALNLSVEHLKAKGKWNYDLIRNQSDKLSEDELEYIEHDTLAGVECLNTLADVLGDTVVSLPFTLTGITRRRVRANGRKNYAKNIFNKQLITYEEYEILRKVFHGGFTHANRGVVGWIRYNVECMDFKSSYSYSMLTTEVPREAFQHLPGEFSIEEILSNDRFAFIFKLVMIKPELKDPNFPMPALQFYKCEEIYNPIIDNGRVLSADYVEIYLNEIDLKIIAETYKYQGATCVEVMSAYKDLMPKWYRDEVFNIFKEKCELEYQIKVLGEGDKSLYNTKKAQLNSLYGNCVQACVKEDIREVYEDTEDLISGDYYIDDIDLKAKFDKYLNDHNQILPYVWGCYVTSAAMLRLFELAECIDDKDRHWIYSDTDSIYSDKWNKKKLNKFNSDTKKKLKKCGYGAVKIENTEYWLGVATPDGKYDRFITQGSKRYAVEKDRKISITVAGVPKSKGAECLSKLEDFKEGFIFSGVKTGKSKHTYIMHDIFIDDKGNECADSIDLSPDDYTLSATDHIDFEDLEKEIVTYDWYE